MDDNSTEVKEFSGLEISLESDLFLRNLLRELTGTLEDVIGLDETAGFVSIVGQKIGDWIDRDYRASLGTDSLNLEQVGKALVDLKRRINGSFRIKSIDKDKIVLVNSNCPFGDKVIDRNSLCMMTSNVFGIITAENLGYAKIELKNTIAAGDPGCHIVVHLKHNDASESAEGNEYYQT